MRANAATPLQTEVAVIGAGAAGLAAARRLHERGVDLLVLEARDRIGGRAYTVASDDGAPVELGAEFIHGAARATFSVMNECGEGALPIARPSFQLRDGRLVKAPDIWESAERILQRVNLNGPDQSIDDFLDALKGAEPADDLNAIRMIVEGFDAAVTSDASTIGIAREWRSGATETSFRPAGGYRPLMQCLARNLGERLLLRTQVRQIEWAPGRAIVRGTRGEQPVEIHARHAVVTLPVSVLESQDVIFAPLLPPEKRSAIDAIAMGPVIKVVLEFRSPFWQRAEAGGVRDAAFFLAPQFAIRTMWTHVPQPVPLLVGWAGGGAARRLWERRLQPVDACLETCQALFPSIDVRAELRQAYYHDWQSDPFALGAYSYLRAGGGDARHVLGKNLEQTLFFAGEATSSDDPGTVDGALVSGYRVAGEITAS